MDNYVLFMDTRSWLYLWKDEIARPSSKQHELKIEEKGGKIDRVEFSADGSLLMLTILKEEKISKSLFYDVVTFSKLMEMDLDEHMTMSERFLVGRNINDEFQINSKRFPPSSVYPVIHNTYLLTEIVCFFFLLYQSLILSKF